MPTPKGYLLSLPTCRMRGTLPAAARRYRSASCVSYLFLLLQQLFLTADIAAITFSSTFLRSCFTVERAMMCVPIAPEWRYQTAGVGSDLSSSPPVATAVLRIITVGDQRQRINTSPLINTSTRTMSDAWKRLKFNPETHNHAR